MSTGKSTVLYNWVQEISTELLLSTGKITVLYNWVQEISTEVVLSTGKTVQAKGNLEFSSIRLRISVGDPYLIVLNRRQAAKSPSENRHF